MRTNYWLIAATCGALLVAGCCDPYSTPDIAVPSVSAGWNHTMVLKTDGTLWAAGWNADGQLGDGTTAVKTTPVQVMSDVADVSAGYRQTLIRKTDATMWATGWNNFGQLCDGTFLSKSTPVQIVLP